MSPEYLSSLFSKSNVPYQLRDNNKLNQPLKRTTTFGINSLAHFGSHLWNMLPHHMMNGYQYHNISRKEKHRYAKRNSGGVGVYIRNNIAKGVEVSKIVNNDFMMWIMLRKDFFNLCHDVYIGGIYIVPEGSTYLRGDEFHILESEIAKIPEDAEILICGDLNAHTNISTDYIDDKYWNWCRCIQRKDSAGVILTASWFNDINIGYRFHISTVCHSCCNNVMYFSKENLDISGSAWKKYHAGMAFLLARIVLVLKLYIQGESCVRPMQASAARLRPGSGILFMTYIDICIIVRRAGLLWSQQDFEWLWSVPLSSASLY